MMYHLFHNSCLLYTSDAADDSLRVDLGGRRIIKKKINTFSKTGLAPPIGFFFQFLFQLCFTTTQGFQKRYTTSF